MAGPVFDFTLSLAPLQAASGDNFFDYDGEIGVISTGADDAGIELASLTTNAAGEIDGGFRA